MCSTRCQRSRLVRDAWLIDIEASSRSSRQLPQEPDFCHLPLAHDGLRRYAEDVSRFVVGQTTEESHLDHLAFALVDGGERREGLIKRNEVATRFNDQLRVIEPHVLGAAAAL